MRSAIIDIGYNALRIVVYDSNKLGATEVFSTKFRNDMLNLLDMHDLNAKHQTYLSFQHLVHIFKKLSVTNVICVATAVLRGHPKTEDFKCIIKERYNIEIDVISGEREAYLTAAGLLSGISDAQGLVIDLGGGSLEFASIANKRVDNLKSLPLGTKIIASTNLSDLDIITNILKQEFTHTNYSNLYLIGGAFRLIGRLYMEFIHYPLKNLHNLEITKKNFSLYLEKIKHLNDIYSLHNVDSNAILVTEALLNVFASAQKIIISNYGLKEGVRFVSLSKEEQLKDIVYERVKELFNFDDKSCDLEKYTNVITALLISPDSSTLKIINLAIMLMQFNKSNDKVIRINLVVEFLLTSSIPFSHRQRLMLGVALAFAFNSRADLYINKLAKKLISNLDYCNSEVIGNFLKIAQKIDGPEFSAPSFSLSLKDNYIEINTTEMLPRYVFNKVCEYLKNIAFARKAATYY